MPAIDTHSHEQLQAHGDDLFVVGFFGEFSATATQALPAFEAFAAAQEVPVHVVDVGRVKGLHSTYGVTDVPSAVTVRDGRVIRRASGAHSAEAWARALLPHAAAPVAGGQAVAAHRVTVYTSPSCVWCTRVKSYLDAQSVRYTEIDVSRDPHAAQALVRRSGQMGVPQTDIDGHLIVGFDKAQINQRLGL